MLTYHLLSCSDDTLIFVNDGSEFLLLNTRERGGQNEGVLVGSCGVSRLSYP